MSIKIKHNVKKQQVSFTKQFLYVILQKGDVIMAYSDVLRNAIANTNYTQLQIAKMCTEMGIKRNKSQINRMVNGELKPSSIEISKVLAKICNIDERLLILEDYFDNAPKEIREVFTTMKYLLFLIISGVFKNKISKKVLEETKIEIEKQPIADFVIELLDNEKHDIEQTINGININSADNLLTINTGVIGFPVKDTSMQPLLQLGSKVTIELKEKYSNNDIVLAKIDNQEDYIIRQIFYLGNQIVLMPLNNDYEQITKDKKNVNILGKVSNLITKI